MRLLLLTLFLPALGSFAHTLQARDASLAVRDSSPGSSVEEYVLIEQTLIKMVRLPNCSLYRLPQ